MGSLKKVRRIANFLNGFGTERKGGVALMAGFAFPLVFLGAGGALDYTNAVTTQKKAQRAMDSTVLALTRRDLNDIDIQTEGETLFNAILGNANLNTTSTEVRFTLTDTVVRGSALVASRTHFLSFIGLDNMPGHVESAAVPPTDRPIEIALVLDVSGSMDDDLNGQPRIERLKSAVNAMFDTLEDSLPSGAQVSASVVPYSTSVNLGDYRNALASSSISGEAKPPAGDDVWAAERVVAVNGTDYTVNDASPGARPIPFVTEGEINRASPTARLAALTDDINDVRSSVSAMTAHGWTAGHIGMAWGVYTLSDSWNHIWPQNPAATGDADKIIVMLSDGRFNTTHNIGEQSNSDGENSDAYFQNTCDLAKDKGITIYAVALALDAASEAKLASCVGVNGRVYPADSASELSNAFEAIARRLGTHRLTS